MQHLASLGDAVSADHRRPSGGNRPRRRRAPRRPDRTGRHPALNCSRQRLGVGKIYAADRIDAALSDYFRLGNLSALRELALLWLADRVDEGLAKYRAEQGIEPAGRPGNASSSA